MKKCELEFLTEIQIDKEVKAAANKKYSACRKWL